MFIGMNDTDVMETKKAYWKMKQIKINFKSENILIYSIVWGGWA